MGDYALLALLCLLVSLGTAGVPGTATITTTTVLSAAGLPLEFLALTLPISTVADMARTMTNVTAAGVASTIVARREGRLDDAVFAARPAPVEPAHRAPVLAEPPIEPEDPITTELDLERLFGDSPARR